jgi:hypothetical protein
MDKIWDTISAGVSGASSVLSAWAWPFVVLVLALIFNVPLTALINRLKTLKIAGFELVLNDYVPASDPANPNMIYMVQLRRSLGKEALVSETVKAPRLSDKQIEESRERAQHRLDADTKKVGFLRGELKQSTEDGSWSIAWGGKYPL